MTRTVMGAHGGKVVVQAAMSLDGFIAGPDDSVDWVTSILSGSVQLLRFGVRNQAAG